MRTLTTLIGATCIATGLMSAAAAQSTADEIAAVKAAVEKYKDVNVALAEGFIPDPSDHCIDAAAEGLPAEWGGMGIHYLNMAALKITAGEPRVDGEGTHTDFMNPAILLYEPQEDGSLELVGVENLVFQKAWHEAGNSDPRPSLIGYGIQWRMIRPQMQTKHMGSNRTTISTPGYSATTRLGC